MSEYYTSNRQVITNLNINTGSTSTPVWSSLCCASEITLNLDTESEDFYVWCDAIQRHLPTGINAEISTTLKVDAQSTGVQEILERVRTILTTGVISTMQNVEIKFDLLTGYDANALTYQTMRFDTNLSLDELGGEAEGSAEIGVTFALNGTAIEGGSV